MGNKQNKITRAEHNDPINFTCGICRKVHPYEGSYDCPDAQTGEEESGV